MVPRRREGGVRGLVPGHSPGRMRRTGVMSSGRGSHPRGPLPATLTENTGRHITLMLHGMMRVEYYSVHRAKAMIREFYIRLICYYQQQI